ncbi:MAG: SPOR domain-containing protein [Bacilli bacterium]
MLRTLGISIKENSSQPESDKKAKYFVQVGAYSKRENAENQLQNAKNAGFSNAFMRLT